MLVHLKLLAAALLWGGTFVAGRLVTQHMGPYSAAFLRFALAGVVLMGLLRFIEKRLPPLTPKLLLGVCLLGMSGVFAYNVLFFSGLAVIPAGRAAVIVATNPIFIALLASVIFKDPLGLDRLAGIALSVCGAVLVISQGDVVALFHQGLSRGDLYICGCVASWVTYSLLGKTVMQGISPLAAVAYSAVAGALMLVPGAVNEGVVGLVGALEIQAWGAIAYLGILGTVVGFTWFYEGVKAIGPARAGVYINIVPISGITCGYLLLGEAVYWSLVAGGALVLAGVWIVNRPRTART